MKRNQALVVTSVVIVILLVAVLFWTTIDNLEKRIDSLDVTVSDLDRRVEALENKTWHPVGDFNLSPSKTSEQIDIKGEEWRLTYTFNEINAGMRIGYNLRIYDANGNIVGGLNGIELADLTNSGKGILNIREGQGNYSVEIRDITNSFTFSFKVEEFY